MKILFFCFVIYFLFAQNGMAQSSEKQDSIVVSSRDIGTGNKFEIWNIDSVQSVYLIYAKRNDSIIKIVSKKERFKNCKTILKGQFYDLKVESLLKNTSSKRHIGGIKYNDIIVKLEGGEVIWDLFICEDFKGLCYTPSTLVTCKKKKRKKA
ncbi:MAG: hypothetical protein RIR12_1575 [Bacteroidota bacterium]|jgi:hypothetical protein